MKISSMSYHMATNRYDICHTVETPSNIMDHDYDSTTSKEYVSTYIHNLIFRDKYTHVKILEFGFTSEMCADMITQLYYIYTCMDMQFYYEISLPSSTMQDVKLSIQSGKEPNESSDMVVLKLTNNTPPIPTSASVALYGEKELKNFISLLEVDEVMEMYLPQECKDSSEDLWNRR